MAVQGSIVIKLIIAPLFNRKVDLFPDRTNNKYKLLPSSCLPTFLFPSCWPTFLKCWFDKFHLNCKCLYTFPLLMYVHWNCDIASHYITSQWHSFYFCSSILHKREQDLHTQSTWEKSTPIKGAVSFVTQGDRKNAHNCLLIIFQSYKSYTIILTLITSDRILMKTLCHMSQHHHKKSKRTSVFHLTFLSVKKRSVRWDNVCNSIADLKWNNKYDNYFRFQR